MIRFRAWGLSAAIAAGAGAPAVAADTPGAPVRQQTTVYNKLFGKPKPKAPAGPGPVAGARPPVVSGPLPEDIQRDAFRAEYEAYLRRLDVCTELRRVALERNDEALQRQVDELERQAAALYNQRVAALGVPKVKAPLPEPTPADDPRIAARRLTAPAPPVPVDPAVRTAEARTPRDTVREVKP